MNESVLCIIGPKYSGKSTLAEKLIEIYVDSLELIETYTDRKKRHDTETGHNFVEPEEFDELIRRDEINFYGKPLDENYRIGISEQGIDEAILNGKVPIIATRVPEIIKGIDKEYNTNHYIIAMRPENISKNAETRDKKLSPEEYTRLGEEMGIINGLIKKLEGPKTPVVISGDFESFTKAMEIPILALKENNDFIISSRGL